VIRRHPNAPGIVIGTALTFVGSWLFLRAYGAAFCEWGTCDPLSDEERRELDRGAVLGITLVGLTPLAVALVSRPREPRMLLATAACAAVGGSIAGGIAAAREIPLYPAWASAAVAAAALGGAVALRWTADTQLLARVTVASGLSLLSVLNLLFGLLLVLLFPTFAILDDVTRRRVEPG
jgi:hypothetical protein